MFSDQKSGSVVGELVWSVVIAARVLAKGWRMMYNDFIIHVSLFDCLLYITKWVKQGSSLPFDLINKWRKKIHTTGYYMSERGVSSGVRCEMKPLMTEKMALAPKQYQLPTSKRITSLEFRTAILLLFWHVALQKWPVQRDTGSIVLRMTLYMLNLGFFSCTPEAFNVFVITKHEIDVTSAGLQSVIYLWT